MRRYWFSSKIDDSGAELEGDLFHHIVEVCRLGMGDKFELLTSDHRAHLVEICERNKKTARVRLIESRNIRPLPRPYIHLALSIPKFSTLESVLEKGVELGVKSFHPFVSDFSYVKKIDESLMRRSQRWSKIVISATQQSGRGDLADIYPVGSLPSVLERFKWGSGAAGLFAYEGDAQKSISQALSDLKNSHLEEVLIIVGSEGGFSNPEVKYMKEKDFEPVTLGEQVLRVETACLTLVSIIKYELL